MEIRLRRKLGAAFCAATLQHQAAGFGRHSGSEAVCASAFQRTGLECAFHGLEPAVAPDV